MNGETWYEWFGRGDFNTAKEKLEMMGFPGTYEDYLIEIFMGKDPSGYGFNSSDYRFYFKKINDNDQETYPNYNDQIYEGEYKIEFWFVR